MSDKRKVKRVLVMLDYGPEDPDSGEVFDLTALVAELRGTGFSADLAVEVKCQRDYSKPQENVSDLWVQFSGYAGAFVHGATHLDDVVNSAVPDGETARNLRDKAKRVQAAARKRVEQLEHDAMVAKLQQVAAIRHQHPIARVTRSAGVLAEISSAHKPSTP